MSFKKFFYEVDFKYMGEMKNKGGSVVINSLDFEDEEEKEFNIFDRIEGMSDKDKDLYELVSHFYTMYGLYNIDIISVKYGISEDVLEDVTKRSLEVYEIVEKEWILESM